MKFSEVYEVKRANDQEWFDPILSHDTRLFIDPLLIESYPDPPFNDARQLLQEFFDFAFREAAATTWSDTNPRFRRLLSMLVFPEVKELCLGYTARSAEGLGGSKQVARLIAEGIYDSLAAGIDSLERFEEVALLKDNIGADRISDMTANILRRQLAEYTLAVCRRNRVRVERFHFPKGFFNFKTVRWEPLEIELPVNPLAPVRRAVLLVPKQLLQKLPSINYKDFGDYLSQTHNEELRDEFGLDVKEGLDKPSIIEIAKRKWGWVKEYVLRFPVRSRGPYDLGRDPSKLYRWYSAGVAFGQSNPLPEPKPTSDADFVGFIDELIDWFKRGVEGSGLWRLLWNDNGPPKDERSAQALFFAVTHGYCRMNNIDITPEAETGRGPVDFKFSNGFARRVHVEVKLASNRKLEHGVTVQVPTYMQADQVQHGRVVVVAHYEELRDAVANRLRIWLRQVRGVDLQGIVVSAVKPPSASRSRRRR